MPLILYVAQKQEKAFEAKLHRSSVKGLADKYQKYIKLLQITAHFGSYHLCHTSRLAMSLWGWLVVNCRFVFANFFNAIEDFIWATWAQG